MTPEDLEHLQFAESQSVVIYGLVTYAGLITTALGKVIMMYLNERSERIKDRDVALREKEAVIIDLRDRIKHIEIENNALKQKRP